MAIPAILGRFAARAVTRGAISKLGGIAVSGAANSVAGGISSTGAAAIMAKLDKLEKMGPDVMEDAGLFFKNKTPVRSGNARNNTKTRDTTIHARYGYAKSLNDGKSGQAPGGMVEPTTKEIKSLIRNYLKGL
jgi:hypothetical protein